MSEIGKKTQAKPFISNENFEYYSWSHRWFYQHLLPDVEEVEDVKPEPVVKPSKLHDNDSVETQSVSPQVKGKKWAERGIQPQTLSKILKGIASSRTSALSREEHIEYMTLCRKKSLTPAEHDRKASLLLTVVKEQTAFLRKARHAANEHVQLYEYLHNDADRYVRELLRNHFKRVCKYPRYYEVKDAIPLTGTSPSVKFKHLATLLDMGQSPRVLIPTLKMKTASPLSYEKISEQFPIGDLPPRENVLHKTPVSADPNAEVLAKKHGAAIVISSSTLKRLADNFGPDFKDWWVVPIVVRRCNTDSGIANIVFVDKPLPPKEMNVYERNYWFHKFSVKTLLLHPNYKKPVNRENVTQPVVPDSVANCKEDVVFENNEGVDFFESSADLCDLEVFGVETSHRKDFLTTTKIVNSPKKINGDLESKQAVTQPSKFANSPKQMKIDLECGQDAIELCEFVNSPKKMEKDLEPIEDVTEPSKFVNSPKEIKSDLECGQDATEPCEFVNSPKQIEHKQDITGPDKKTSMNNDELKTDVDILDSNVSAVKLEALRITDDTLPKDAEDSESVASLVIDEKLSPQKDTEHLKHETSSPDRSASGLFSPRSTCSSDALWIDESYDSPEWMKSPFSSQSDSAAGASTADTTGKPRQRRLKQIKRKSSCSAKTKVDKKAKTIKTECDSNRALQSKSVTWNTTPSNLLTEEKDMQPSEPKGMVTRSRSRSASDVGTPKKPKTVTDEQTKNQLGKTSELEDGSKTTAGTSEPEPKLVPSRKKLLLDMFGSSSSDEEGTRLKTADIPKERQSRPRKKKDLSTKLKSSKPLLVHADTNPLTRILAEQEKMLQNTGKVDSTSKTALGVSSQSSSTSVIKIAPENPNEFFSFATDKQVEYDLFSLGGTRLLVRSSVHGITEANPKRRIKGERYSITPKLEYQSICGGEVLSPSEEVRQIVDAMVRPHSKVVQVRIDAYSSVVLGISMYSCEEYACRSQSALDLIHALLQKLPHLPAGNYLLKHKKNEGFANILRQVDEAKPSAYDLHGSFAEFLAEQPAPITTAPWLPIDPNVFFSQHAKRIPATFQPGNFPKGQRKPPQRKIKKGKSSQINNGKT